MVTPKI